MLSEGSNHRLALGELARRLGGARRLEQVQKRRLRQLSTAKAQTKEARKLGGRGARLISEAEERPLVVVFLAAAEVEEGEGEEEEEEAPAAGTWPRQHVVPSA